MVILGIESSCDETAAAIVENGTKILANTVTSSLVLHQKTGGVIPEIAAREQIKAIIPIIQTALEEAHKKPADLDAIAVTVGPGLVGSLLVGVETAKILALVWQKPIVPVNHLWGHIYASWLNGSPKPKFPLVALIVSGGHTDLVLLEDHGKLKWLGGTLDDAAGEAFDKVARFLGLPYPGGPEIERVAKEGNGNTFALPRPLIGVKNFDFSFSGLKTAVIREFEKNPKLSKKDLIASFQKAVVDVLVEKTIRAAEKFEVKTIVVGGGVAANSALRFQLSAYCKRLEIPVSFPPIELCTDNAAVIASAAFFNYKPVPPEKIQAYPSLHF